MGPVVLAHERRVPLHGITTGATRDQFPTTGLRQLPRHMVISDASTNFGYGIIIVDTVSWTVEAKSCHQWKCSFSEKHIFRLEAFAACEGLKLVRNLHPEIASVIMCTDNTALAGALLRGYSTVDEVNDWFKAENSVCSMDTDVMTVVSEEMPADALSRGETDAEVDVAKIQHLHQTWIVELDTRSTCRTREK